MSVNGLDLVDSFDLSKQRPPLASFHRDAKKKGVDAESGLPQYEDVDFVTVRQPGGTDSVIFETTHWFKKILPMEVENGRLNPRFAELYKQAYERWKSGQETVLEGTAIKMWPVATPAQVKLLIDSHILTVEDLATLPDDGVRRLGMGGLMLKQKAMAWLVSAQNTGKATHEIVELQKKNDLLEKNLASMQSQLDALKEKKGKHVAA